MVTTLLIVGIIVAVVVLYLIIIFNSLVRLRVKVKNAWAQIDVQLKRRYDLIPNLVDAVKGYMKHEKSVLTEITNARANLTKGPIEKRAEASNQITEALKSIFAVAENYPDLKASENFKMLQEELSGTENKISYSRQFYNDSVMRLNTKVQVFPTNIFAKMMGFTKEKFFKTENEAERKPVKVKF
jgi:LemA protein